MEPIPYFYDSINRNAIVIKPKKPFFDWVNKIYPEDPITELKESSIYLVKEADNQEAAQRWLTKNFDRIFVNELNDWHTDEVDWPSARTFYQFKNWFDYELFITVLDVENTRIEKNVD